MKLAVYDELRPEQTLNTIRRWIYRNRNEETIVVVVVWESKEWEMCQLCRSLLEWWSKWSSCCLEGGYTRTSWSWIMASIPRFWMQTRFVPFEDSFSLLLSTLAPIEMSILTKQICSWEPECVWCSTLRLNFVLLFFHFWHIKIFKIWFHWNIFLFFIVIVNFQCKVKNDFIFRFARIRFFLWFKIEIEFVNSLWKYLLSNFAQWHDLIFEIFVFLRKNWRENFNIEFDVLEKISIKHFSLFKLSESLVTARCSMEQEEANNRASFFIRLDRVEKLNFSTRIEFDSNIVSISEFQMMNEICLNLSSRLTTKSHKLSNLFPRRLLIPIQLSVT